MDTQADDELWQAKLAPLRRDVDKLLEEALDAPNAKTKEISKRDIVEASLRRANKTIEALEPQVISLWTSLRAERQVGNNDSEFKFTYVGNVVYAHLLDA